MKPRGGGRGKVKNEGETRGEEGRRVGGDLHISVSDSFRESPPPPSSEAPERARKGNRRNRGEKKEGCEKQAGGGGRV